jgi:hypothetical protein
LSIQPKACVTFKPALAAGCGEVKLMMQMLLSFFKYTSAPLLPAFGIIIAIIITFLFFCWVLLHELCPCLSLILPWGEGLSNDNKQSCLMNYDASRANPPTSCGIRSENTKEKRGCPASFSSFLSK